MNYQSIMSFILLLIGCFVNGQKVTEERSVVLAEDPCVTCKCKSNRLTCAKQACPVLHCPLSKVVHDPRECCPRCKGMLSTLSNLVLAKKVILHLSFKIFAGNGKYMLPPRGACILGNNYYDSGSKFHLDTCTRCSCSNSVISCAKETCPVLECPSEHQTTLPGRCCPQCPVIEESRASCTYGGKTFGASTILVLMFIATFLF